MSSLTLICARSGVMIVRSKRKVESVWSARYGTMVYMKRDPWWAQGSAGSTIKMWAARDMSDSPLVPPGFLQGGGKLNYHLHNKEDGYMLEVY